METSLGEYLDNIFFEVDLLEDPLRLEPAATNLVRRLALVAFYFATTRLLTYCNPLAEEPDFRWLSDTPESQWTGVVCDQGAMSKIYLGESRSLDEEICHAMTMAGSERMPHSVGPASNKASFDANGSSWLAWYWFGGSKECAKVQAQSNDQAQAYL